ncbi:MAG: chorismate mutase [Clostridia bacterium]|nr:chorismate mutase [Clostridia bacterium]
MQNLDELRQTINEVDEEMAKLFTLRMETVKKIAEYKMEKGKPIFDAKREEEVIKRNSEKIENKELVPFYRTFLENNMAVSRDYQKLIISGMRIAYSGVEGAFAHIAAKNIFPDSEYVSYPNFKAAYKAVEKGECNCAVLPVENSNSGEVGQVSDLVFSGSLNINAMYNLEIMQNLVGVKGTTKDSIKEVISHPQALSQCEAFLKERGYKTSEYENTALAAKKVKELNDVTIAAVASKETANLYGLEIIENKINEDNTNTTRFAVLSPSENKAAGDENYFDIMFTVKHEAGALAKAIDIIGRYGFNMTKLRSRALKELAWQYYFQIEAEGDIFSMEGKIMLSQLEKFCDRLKVAGVYPKIKNLNV